ncbi:MAG: glycosyltransferase family 4 protein [bacterium]|jgi:glycosyltransferase involved in cell wall biosynthesis
MRIGFDAKRAFSNFTGLGNYSRSTLKLLTELHPENDYFLYNPRVPDEHQIKFLDLPHNAKVHIKIPQSFFFEVFPSTWRRYGITADLVRDKIDLYHGLSHEIPVNIHNTNVKSIVTIHDLIFKVYPEYYKLADRKIYDSKFKHACETADGIIAISECTKKDIIKYYNIDSDKIKVIYQGCSTIFKEQTEEKTKQEIKLKYNLPDNYLLSVGSIERRKNTKLILETLNKINSDTSLVLVGKKTEYCNELNEYINSNQLNDRVIFLHDVKFNELPSIYQQARIFIYPSRYEGFGIPILEALHSRIPVIAAKDSCLEEAGGLMTKYIDPDSSDELINAINELLTSEEINKIIEFNLEFVKKFDANIIADELMNYYTEILNK